jgi:hypothetical protein
MNGAKPPKVPVAGVVYGETVYWMTIVGSLISIVGATMGMWGAECRIHPSYVFSAIWEGRSTADIWEGAVGQIPNGHWYLEHFGTGDSLAMFGLVIGVFSVIPGMIASAIILFRKKEPLFAVFALLAAGLCLVSCFGLISMPS